jgi:glycosyltransferase involved in cell wall biosynthesis
LLLARGVPSDKIKVIPNWADEDTYKPTERESALARHFGFVGTFNVVFAGNMGPAQGLHTVLDAAELLSDEPSIRFVLVGDGIDFQGLQDAVRSRGLKNVVFTGRQPQERMPLFLAWGDLLLVHLRDEPLFRITIPSKIIAYLASARPILCAVEGDAAQMVKDSGGGIVCSPSRPQLLADRVREVFKMSPDARAAMGEAGRNAFLRNYTRRHLLDEYETTLTAAASRKGR